jgi:hypothetical protein
VIQVIGPDLVHGNLPAVVSAVRFEAVDTGTRDTGLGVHLADLPTPGLQAGATVRFTLYWPQAGHWEGADFSIDVVT